MSFRGKGQVGSTLVFFWNVRVHHISSFFSRYVFYFFVQEGITSTNTPLLWLFFITFGRKLSYLDLHSMYLWHVIFFLYSFNIRRGCSLSKCFVLHYASYASQHYFIDVSIKIFLSVHSIPENFHDTGKGRGCKYSIILFTNFVSNLMVKICEIARGML